MLRAPINHDPYCFSRLVLNDLVEQFANSRNRFIVYRDNEPAYQCYRGIGFEVVDYPLDMPMADVCYYLTRPVTARPDDC